MRESISAFVWMGTIENVYAYDGSITYGTFIFDYLGNMMQEYQTKMMDIIKYLIRTQHVLLDAAHDLGCSEESDPLVSALLSRSSCHSESVTNRPRFV